MSINLNKISISIILISAFIILYIVSFIPIYIIMGNTEDLSFTTPVQVWFIQLVFYCGKIPWLPIWYFQFFVLAIAMATFVLILFAYSKKSVRSLIIALIGLANLMFLPLAVDRLLFAYELIRYCGP